MQDSTKTITANSPPEYIPDLPELPIKPPFLDTNEQVDNIDKVHSLKPDSLNWKIGKIIGRDTILSPLIDYAKIVGSKNLQEYYAAFMCGKTLVQSENMYLSQRLYCGSRLCPLCSNIRTMKLFDLYEPILKLKSDWVMLTLTDSNESIEFSIEGLKNRIKADELCLNKINKALKYNKLNTDAIISLEIVPEGYKRYARNTNIVYANAHPHYHILCQNKTAEFIKAQWIVMHPTANPLNQNITKIPPDKLDKAIREVVKYSIKSFLPKLSADKGSVLNLKGVDDIITLMKGRRRLKCWGAFYNYKTADIELKDIKELELKKQKYEGLPVMDTGELVDVKYINGKMEQKPSFIAVVEYNLIKVQGYWNYYYEDGDIQIPLTSYRPDLPYKKNGKLITPKKYKPPILYVGKEYYTDWRKKNNTNPYCYEDGDIFIF